MRSTVAFHPMRRQVFDFVGSSGTTLSGRLDLPDERARGAVLMAHCFTCTKDVHTQTRLSRALVEAGYATMRFDFTGLGGSDGDVAATTVSSNLGDLRRAAMALIQRGVGPCGLLGHSLGGAAALMVAADLKTVRSVVTVAAPSTPGHVRHLFADAVDVADDRFQVRIGGRPFEIGQDFVDDLDRHDSASAIADLGRPLLVVHPVDDSIVPVSEGEAIFAAARQPKSFVPLLGTDHMIAEREAADELARVVVGWFDATL